MSSSSVKTIQRVTVKKTTNGDIAYLDFDYSADFEDDDVIDPNAFAVTITPSGELVQVAGIKIDGLRVQIKLNAAAGIAQKEYLVAAEAVTVSGLRKTLEAVICIA